MLEKAYMGRRVGNGTPSAVWFRNTRIGMLSTNHSIITVD
jgi:hypothetical protein